MNLEILVPAAELKSALPGLAKVVSKSCRLPVLQCLRLARDESGAMTVQATDLDSFVTYRLERSQLGPPAKWLAPFAQFSKAVKESLPTDRLGFLLAGDHCHLRSFIGHVPVDEDITAGAPTDWPPMPSMTGPAAVLESRFKTALSEALSCVSRDPTRLMLQGAYLDIAQPDMHYLVSTDKRQLYVANSFHFGLPQPVILPQRKFLVWPGFLNDGEWRLRVRPASNEEGAWIELASRHWGFLTKALDGPYPDWRQIEPAESADKTLLIFSQLATNHLEAVLPRLPSWQLDGQPMKLKTNAEQVFVCGRQEAHGRWIEVPIPGVAISGNPIEVTFNRACLLKALRFGMLELELSAPDISPVFRAKDKKLVVACYKQDPASPARPAPEPSEPPSADDSDDSGVESWAPGNEPETAEVQEAAGESPPASEDTPPDCKDDDEPVALEHALDPELGHVRHALIEVLTLLQELLPLLDSLEQQNQARENEIKSLRETIDALEQEHS